MDRNDHTNNEKMKGLTKVGIRHGDAPAEMTLDLLREVGDIDLKGRSVLIKPNVGFKSRPGLGVITDCEVVRGVIRFVKESGAGRIWVGDSSIYGIDTYEALESAGMVKVAEEEMVEVVNLDAGESVSVEVPEPMAVDRIKVSSLAMEADVIISVPVMKTHMHAVASLGLKNMKGCLYRRQKMRFHHLQEKERFAAWHDYRNLDRAIADLSSVLLPDLVVVDGIVAMEGLGPMVGDPKPLGLVLAGLDALAVDAAAAYIMGFSPTDLGHLVLAAAKRRRPVPSIEDMDMDRAVFDSLRSPFRPALPEDISASFPDFVYTEGESCSACQGTVMAFLKGYGQNYIGRGPIELAVGRNIDPDRLTCERLILLGNCAAELRGHGIFIEGCPPIPSDVVFAIESLPKDED